MMMNLESLKFNAEQWHDRQILNDIKKQKPLWRQLMLQSKKCMVEHGLSQSLDSVSVKKAIQCEMIHPASLSNYTNFTWHTHPSMITHPSQADIKTTKQWKKRYLVIGVVPSMKNYVYHTDDNFEKVVATF